MVNAGLSGVTGVDWAWDDDWAINEDWDADWVDARCTAMTSPRTRSVSCVVWGAGRRCEVGKVKVD